MTTSIKLYSDDFTRVLLETDSHDAAHQFLRDSGEKSVAAVIDQAGPGWQTRWSGRIVLDDKPGALYVGDREYLKHITEPINPFVT